MSESFTAFLDNATSSYDTWSESINWDEKSSYSVPNESSVIPSSSHPKVQLPYYSLVIIALYLTVVGVISTIGNILFIVTVMRWWIMRNNAHMLLLLNMAICDLAISITGYPYTTISGYAGRWIFGVVMCQIYGFLCFTLAQVSMNTLVAVSIFRYIAICKPHFKHLLTREASNRAIAVVWAHALFWTSAPLFGWSGYALEPNGIACSFDWNDRSVGGISYVVGCIIFCYVTHIAIMTWCYTKIFSRMHNLKQSHDHRRSKSQLDNLQRLGSQASMVVVRCESSMVFSFITENLSPLEIHVLRMNIIMVLTYTIIWSPYAIISIISLFYTDLSPTWYIFPTIFAKTSCMMNPIIYGVTNKFLRKELLSVIRKVLGLTTPMEDFQFMRQRQQEGLFDKEGIYTGMRNVAASSCTCEGCVQSRRHMTRLSQQQRLQQLSSRNPSPSTPVEPSLAGNEKEIEEVKKANELRGLLLSPCGENVTDTGISFNLTNKNGVQYPCNTLDLKNAASSSCGKNSLNPESIGKMEGNMSETMDEAESHNYFSSRQNFKCTRSMSLVAPYKSSSRSCKSPSHKRSRRNSYCTNYNLMKLGLLPNAKIISSRNEIRLEDDNADVGTTGIGTSNNITPYCEESAV